MENLVDESNDIMKNTRSKVIKLLQEQVADLQSQKNDVEIIRSRLITAEEELILQEKKYKIKIDDLEYANNQLSFENQELKHLLLNLQSKITPEAKPVTFDIEEGIDYAAKARKWKTKYHALAKSDPDSNALFQADKLDVQVKALTAQLEIVKNELMETKQQKQKLVNELAISNGTLRILKGMVNDVDEKNKELETKNGQIEQQKEKAKAEKKHKEILLEHQRQKEEKRKKEIAEKTKNAKVEVENQKQVVSQKEEEVKSLNEAVQREVKSRKRLEKKLENVTLNLSNEIDTLKQENYKLKQENNALQESLDIISNSSSSIREKFQQLQQEKSDLQDALVKTGHYKAKSTKLEGTVNELQSTIKTLNDDITQMSAETSNKQDDLRSVIARHFENHNGGDWQENLDFISNKFEDLEEANKSLAKLQKKIDKSQKLNDNLNAELLSKEKTIEALQIDVQQLRNALQTRGKYILSGSTKTKLNSSSLNQNSHSGSSMGIKEPSEDDNTIENDICKFRNAIWRKIDATIFKSTNVLREALSSVEKKEITIPSARSVILSMIFLIKWTRFDKNLPFDPQSILVFAGPRNNRPIYMEVKEKISKLLESNETMQAKVGIASFNHQEQLEHISTLQEQLTISQSEVSRCMDELEQAKQKIEQMKKEKDGMISKTILQNTQAQLNERSDALRKTEEQLRETKAELARLLDAVDSTQALSDDQRASILSLNNENEALKIRLDEVLSELDKCQLSLKEKTREILCLERKLSKSRGQTALVKDSIPLSEQPPSGFCQLEAIKSAFFISDSVRNDLFNMKNKIVNQDRNI